MLCFLLKNFFIVHEKIRLIFALCSLWILCAYLCESKDCMSWCEKIDM